MKGPYTSSYIYDVHRDLTHDPFLFTWSPSKLQTKPSVQWLFKVTHCSTFPSFLSVAVNWHHRSGKESAITSTNLNSFLPDILKQKQICMSQLPFNCSPNLLQRKSKMPTSQFASHRSETEINFNFQWRRYEDKYILILWRKTWPADTPPCVRTFFSFIQAYKMSTMLWSWISDNIITSLKKLEDQMAKIHMSFHFINL